MSKTNFTAKVKAAYSKLIKDGEYNAANWLLRRLNTKHYIESLPMSIYCDQAWLCAHVIDPNNSGYSFRIR